MLVRYRPVHPNDTDIMCVSNAPSVASCGRPARDGLHVVVDGARTRRGAGGARDAGWAQVTA